MAEITKSMAADYTQLMRTQLIPSDFRRQMPQDELADRLAYVSEMEARAASCGSHVLAGCYRQISKMVLQAKPRDEVAAQARGLRAKARLMGNAWGDNALRQADALEAANPAAPPRGSVRKAAGDALPVLLYDCNVRPFGIADPDDITPVADPDVILKAASVGMVATHDEAGKLRGFVHPDKVRPIASLTAQAQAKNTGPVKAGGTTGAGQPRQTGPAGALPADGPQAVRPGDVPDRQVVKAATPEQVIKSLGPNWMPVYDWTGHLGGAVPRSRVTTAAPGQVLKAAATTYANIYDARRRKIGTAPMAAIVHLADLVGRKAGGSVRRP